MSFRESFCEGASQSKAQRFFSEKEVVEVDLTVCSFHSYGVPCEDTSLCGGRVFLCMILEIRTRN